MLHFFPKSFLNSSSRLGDPWKARWFSSCGFRLGLLFPSLADHSRGAGRLSGRCCSSRYPSCSSRVLISPHFDPLCRWFSFGGSWSDRPPGVAGQSARLGLAAVLARTIHYSRCATGGSVFIFGPSVRDLRTVCPYQVDRPPGHRGLSARCLAELLSSLLLVFHFCFGIVWGLFLGLVAPL
jgi:hypothetical protein